MVLRVVEWGGGDEGWGGNLKDGALTGRAVSTAWPGYSGRFCAWALARLLRSQTVWAGPQGAGGPEAQSAPLHHLWGGIGVSVPAPPSLPVTTQEPPLPSPLLPTSRG